MISLKVYEIIDLQEKIKNNKYYIPVEKADFGKGLNNYNMEYSLQDFKNLVVNRGCIRAVVFGYELDADRMERYIINRFKEV